MVVGRCTCGGASGHRRAPSFEVVVAGTVWLPIHEDNSWVGLDRADGGRSILQLEVAARIRKYQIVNETISWSVGTRFEDAVLCVMHDDVVRHQRVVVANAARIVAGSDANSKCVTESKFVRDDDVVGSVPEMDAASATESRYVVPDVPTQIRLVDAVNSLGATGVAIDVLDSVSDHVVVARMKVGIVDSGTAIGLAVNLKIMDVVADDAHEGTVILNSDVAAPGDVEALDVDKVSFV